MYYIAKHSTIDGLYAVGDGLWRKEYGTRGRKKLPSLNVLKKVIEDHIPANDLFDLTTLNHVHNLRQVNVADNWLGRLGALVPSDGETIEGK